MQSTEDGRPRQAYISSSRKGFKGIRRIAECKCSHIRTLCIVAHMQQFKTFKPVQFESSGGKRVYSCCGYAADHTPCEAIKMWEFQNGHSATTVIVYHEGTHSCTAVRPERSADEYVKSVLKKTNT